MSEQELYDAVRAITPPPSLRDKVLSKARQCASQRDLVVSRSDRGLDFLFRRIGACTTGCTELNPDYYKNSPSCFMLCDSMNFECESGHMPPQSVLRFGTLQLC